MADLAITIFGLAVPVVRGLVTLCVKLDEISSAPKEIKLFKSEIKILRASIDDFRRQSPAAIQKLAFVERQEALDRAEELIKHFQTIMKSIKAATSVILMTFGGGSGLFKRLYARTKWTFKKSAISEARQSMILLVSMINLFSDFVMVESAQQENERNGASSRELRHQLHHLAKCMRRDHAQVRDALAHGRATKACRCHELQMIQRTAKFMNQRAETVIGSLDRELSRTRQSGSDNTPRHHHQPSPASWSASRHCQEPFLGTPRRCRQHFRNPFNEMYPGLQNIHHQTPEAPWPLFMEDEARRFVPNSFVGAASCGFQNRRYYHL